jgi:hypothetical protein
VPAPAGRSTSRYLLRLRRPRGIPEGKEYSLIYSDAGGTVTHTRTTGALAVTLTNSSNGHTHTFNISGPGDLVPNADGSTTLTATGNWIFFFAPGQLGVGSPGAMVTFTGRTVLWSASLRASTRASRVGRGARERICGRAVGGRGA